MKINILKTNFHKTFILILVISISVFFFIIIQDYILSIFLAAIFSGLLYPFYLWFLKKLKGFSFVASGIVITLVLLLIIIPSAGIISLVLNEAIDISQDLVPLVQNEIKNSSSPNHQLPDWLPFAKELEPYKSQFFIKISELASQIGKLLVANLSSFTQGTLVFFLNVFLMLYAMFFFLIQGAEILKKISYYTPLNQDEFQQMIDRGLSITRATLKGALLIGILQGSLVGLAFWFIGIKGAAFWGAISVAMSVIPSVGSAIIWMPAVAFLFFTGEVFPAIGLFIWGAGIVGTIDNLLRPYLIGKDTKMPDLLIFLSTVGGLSFFGMVGFIIGPIVAGLFLTIWEIYRHTLEEELNT